MPTTSPALVPTFISFDDDDDFGEFEFATSVSASSSPVPPHCADSNQKQRQQAAGEEDDDWGDFVESSFQPQLFGSSDPQPPPPPSSSVSSSTHFPSFFHPPFPASEAAAPDPAPIRPPPPVAPNKGWQKPSGALPLSLFGGEDGEEDGGGEEASNSIDSLMPDLKAGLFGSPKSLGSKGLVSAQGGGLKDLIASLYGQADKNVATVTPGNRDENGHNLRINGDNGATSVSADGGDNDEEELDDWEFKDALSSASVGDSGDSVLVEAVKKDDVLADIPGFESKDTNSGSGLQVSGNYIFQFNGQERENTLGTNLPSRAFTDEQEWGSAFVSHGTTVNGFDFGFADNGCNGYASNALHDFEHINIENGLDSNAANGGLSLDDSSWEFRDASSDVEIVKHFTEPESISQMALNELGNPAGGNKNQGFGDPFLITEGSPHVLNSIDNGTENNKAGSVVDLNNLMSNTYNGTCHVSAVTSKQITHSEQISVVSSESLKGADSTDLKYTGLESDKIRDDFVSKNMDTEITTVVDFYSRLKQKSCTLAHHHIDNNELRQAAEEVVPDEELEAVDFDDEIKVAISKLGTAVLKSDHIEKCPPNDFSISELLEVIQQPCFEAFDMEYHLSEKIPLAEKDLSSAMWLFEHASSVLYILMLASCEEQHGFINLWSKMVSACELELQHGAMIWSQALHANVQTQLLSESRGEHFFFALGEIYRVVEILSAAIRLYKPWIFLNPAGSRDMLSDVEKSIEAWTDSGLKQALEIISESSGELNVATEKLLESTKFISELSTSTLQTLLSNHGAHFCRLSLLPLELLPDIKQVVWNGDPYFSKLANLWANRISLDAPQLPHINVAQ